jgi:aryl-alcohol dehydrogenase-like predicted oxidoreductase
MRAKLTHHSLGQTDIRVSPIGLGTVKFGRNQAVKYPESFQLPSDNDLVDLLKLAKELNINTLDTAPAYGSSEQRLGQLLKGSRKDWVIIGKAGETFEDGVSSYDFSADFIKKSVEQSLQNLNTDYLDVLLIHSNGDDVNIIEHDKVFTTLAELKAQNIIRAFGMSTKTIEGGLRTIEEADVAMVTYNPIETSEKIVIDAACKNNKGILIKKAFASGHLNKIPGEDPVQSVMDFIFKTAGVGSIILGTINPEHLQHNVEAALRAINEGAIHAAHP